MEFYKHLDLKRNLKIESFVNASRAYCDKNYAFPGESHDFWEFQYMAEGSAVVYINNEFYQLKKGYMTFSSPISFIFSGATECPTAKCGYSHLSVTCLFWKISTSFL